MRKEGLQRLAPGVAVALVAVLAALMVWTVADSTCAAALESHIFIVSAVALLSK